jgi:hypothetical protein
LRGSSGVPFFVVKTSQCSRHSVARPAALLRHDAVRDGRGGSDGAAHPASQLDHRHDWDLRRRDRASATCRCVGHERAISEARNWTTVGMTGSHRSDRAGLLSSKLSSRTRARRDSNSQPSDVFSPPGAVYDSPLKCYGSGGFAHKRPPRSTAIHANLPGFCIRKVAAIGHRRGPRRAGHLYGRHRACRPDTCTASPVSGPRTEWTGSAGATDIPADLRRPTTRMRPDLEPGHR